MLLIRRLRHKGEKLGLIKYKDIILKIVFKKFYHLETQTPGVKFN